MESETDIKKRIKEVAERLAREHGEIEPTVESIYWFPAVDEIRFVELDSATIASEEIEPFYFTPDLEGGVPFPSGVAVIRADEKDKLKPPEGWGDWDNAELIWERET